jgi:hypothetical protein
MPLATINDCRFVSLPRVVDPRGSLTFLESNNHVPFDIKRVFYIYDVPTEEGRGAHAHRELQQMLVCLGGSFDVEVDDGEFQARIHLNRPWKGLLLPPMIWAAEVNFDPGSVCLVLTSALYDERDYIRDHDEFLRLRAAGSRR